MKNKYNEKKRSIGSIITRRRKISIALKLHSGTALMTLTGKSKLLWQSLQINTGKKGLVRSVDACQMSDVVVS